MDKRFILFAAVLVFALGAMTWAQDGTALYSQQALTRQPNTPDPGIPDTVRVETKVVPATDSFMVDVFLYNDEELGGMAIPLGWSSSDFELDTVLFDGSRVEYISARPVTIENTNQRVVVGVIVFFESFIQPGSGLLFTMHFRAKPGISDQVFTIDSTFFPPTNHLSLILANASNITPQYVPGEITWGTPMIPIISLDPTSFTFSAPEGGANPPSQPLAITNIGSGILNWTASNNTGWLSVTPSSGTDDATVNVAVDITGLAVGTYDDTIIVSDPAASNNPQRAPVTLTIEEPPPSIVLDPTSFGYTITEGDDLPDDQLSITNAGGGTLNWTAATSFGTWLSLLPTSGTGDATVTLSFTVSGLTAGTYTDTISVSDPAADNTPQKAVVTVTIEEPPPSIVLDPTSFGYTITEGDDLPDDQLSITNAGGGTLNWTATTSFGTWLSLLPTSGTGNATVTLSFTVSGLTAGTYTDTITVSDPAADNTPQKAVVTVTVEEPPPSIVLDPTSFGYTITEGDVLPDDQLSITNAGGGTLNWTATTSFGTWLSLLPTSGTGDATVTLSFTVSGLTAGTYTDTITVSDPAADNTPQKAVVAVTVEEPPPTIAVDPTSFAYTITEGNAIPDTQVAITNTGGGTLNWTVSNVTAWLTLNPTSGSGDATVVVSFDVAGVPAGTYHDTITVSDPAATNDPVTVPVVVTITAAPVPVISVSPTSFTFDAEEGGANPPDQILSITNIGEGTLAWTATNSAGWLSLDPTSGSGDGSVTLSVDITGLADGVYYDTIVVADPAAGNSPVAVPVMLTIEALPELSVTPASIDITAIEGDAIPSETITVINAGGGVLTWTASNLTGWITLTPTSGGNDDTLITVDFDITGVTEGVYYDTITVSSPEAVNSPQAVAVTLTVQAAPPTIALDPVLIELSAIEGGAIPDEQITVSNTGGGTLNWTGANQTGWITLDPTGGTGDGIITLNFDITGVGPGLYADTIVVSDPAATNTPQTAVVTLSISEPLPDADTVYVQTIEGAPGEQVMVGVAYVNFTPTYGFTLPLSFDPSPVDCDSVSFEGTRVVIADESWVVIDNVAGTIQIQGFTINAPILDPGSGLIAKMYFTIDPGAAEQLVVLDTTSGGGFIFEDSTYIKKTEFFTGGIDINVSVTPCFEFPTDTVAFDINVGEIVPSISFPVTNGCGGTLEWTVSVADSWAIVTPASGIQDDQVTFTVDTTGLAPGSYVTTATFESNGDGTPYEVIIVLNFTHYPEIAVSPEMIQLGSICKGDTVMGSFDITNSGGGTLDWHADVLADFGMTLSAYAGTAPSTVEYEILTELLAYGPQTFEIAVTSDNALNSPQIVQVKLTVVNCDECSFDIAEVEGGSGQDVAVPVHAYGIVDAAGVQFNIAYDAAIVAPDSVTSAYMTGPTIGFADDAVHFVWEDFNNPITVPDGEPIIVMWFTIIGDAGQTSCFNWTGINEVADVNGIPFPGLSFCGGCLTVVEPYFDLSGTIVYYDMVNAVPGVTVDLTGDATAGTVTDIHGDYMFTDVGPGDYLITPFRSDDDEGVSVGDAVEMRRHIAFVETFDSPYKLIAADINLTGTVTVSDVILVRRYLAELDPLASGNWMFVDADYAITMDNWPLAPHDIAVSVIGSGHDMLDFIAIRMGDVDGTWSQPKAIADGTIEIELTIPELDGAPATDIVVPVNVTGFTDVAGVESHINFDETKMTVDSITSANLADPTVNAIDGRIHFIWEDFTSPMTLSDGESFMLIHARVLPTATGNIQLTFTGRCELVNETGNPYPVVFNDGTVFITPTDADDDDGQLPGQFSLEQNYPNPFNPSTTISYTVDQTMELLFEVYNVSGQLVDRIDLGRKSAGSYSFVYQADRLPSGIYTYRLVGNGVSQARQMLLLK